MSKNDSYLGGSTTFHLGSDWVSRDKKLDAETIRAKEREAEEEEEAKLQWFAETSPNQDLDLQRERIGKRERQMLRKKNLKEAKKRKKVKGGND